MRTVVSLVKDVVKPQLSSTRSSAAPLFTHLPNLSRMDRVISIDETDQRRIAT